MFCLVSPWLFCFSHPCAPLPLPRGLWDPNLTLGCPFLQHLPALLPLAGLWPPGWLEEPLVALPILHVLLPHPLPELLQLLLHGGCHGGVEVSHPQEVLPCLSLVPHSSVSLRPLEVGLGVVCQERRAPGGSCSSGPPAAGAGDHGNAGATERMEQGWVLLEVGAGLPVPLWAPGGVEGAGIIMGKGNRGGWGDLDDVGCHGLEVEDTGCRCHHGQGDLGHGFCSGHGHPNDTGTITSRGIRDECCHDWGIQRTDSLGAVCTAGWYAGHRYLCVSGGALLCAPAPRSTRPAPAGTGSS